MLTLDLKGRLTVPSRFKDALIDSAAGQLMVTKNPDGCLQLFPMPVWSQWEKVLLSLPVEHDAWRRLYIGSATEADIDTGSRVLIPPELRAWAGMDRDVKFMGMGPYFELWDTARYETREALAIAAGRPEALRNIVLQ